MGLFNPARTIQAELSDEILSPIPPIKLREGQRWSEEDSTGNLVNQWIKQGRDWVSPVKTITFLTPRATSQDIRIPVNPVHKIMLLESRLFIQVFVAMAAGASIEISHNYFDTIRDAPVGRSIHPRFTTFSLPNNGVVNTVSKLNLLVDCRTKDFLQISSRSTGSPTNHAIGSQVDYYLIRK